MAVFVWGYRNTVRNTGFLGLKPCGRCGRPEEMYLARSCLQLKAFSFIPFLGFPTGRYLRCGSCDSGRRLTVTEWRELKKASRGMPNRKDYLRAYDELRQLAESMKDDEPDAVVLYERLIGNLDFADQGNHIRDLVDTYLDFRKAEAEKAEKAHEDVTGIAAGDDAL